MAARQSRTNVRAVLIVVPAGDPAGLSSPGLGGCPVPLVHQRWIDARETWESSWSLLEHTHGFLSGPENPPHCALPLWWEGELVPEGWDRFRRAMYRASADGHRFPERLFDVMFPTLDEVRAMAADAVRLEVASDVLLLEETRGELVVKDLEPA